MSKEVLTVTVKRSADRAFPFDVDPEVSLQDARSDLQLSGWAIHPDFEISEIVLGQGEEILQRAQPFKHRPLAFQQHSALPGAARCGYELSHPNPVEGAYWLAAAGSPDGGMLRMADLQLTRKKRPQVFYMHIAKAGGSTVNKMFSRRFAKEFSKEHIESSTEWRDDPALLEGYEFLSGHLGLEILDQRINLARFHLVTVVREPLAQLISHFAWIRRLAEPGEESRLANHPPYVQAFAKKLAGYDLGDPASIAPLINSLNNAERRLVDNYQVRHFATVPGAWVGRAELDSAKRAVSRFRHIGVASNLDEFFQNVAEDMQWPEMPPAERVNVTTNFFHMDPANPDLAEALLPLIRFDRMLYEYILENRNLTPRS